MEKVVETTPTILNRYDRAIFKILRLCKPRRNQSFSALNERGEAMDDPRFSNLTKRVWESFHTFRDEAIKIRTLVEKLPCPATSQEYEELLAQRLCETQALENYLQSNNQLFVHLRVREKCPVEKKLLENAVEVGAKNLRGQEDPSRAVD